MFRKKYLILILGGLFTLLLTSCNCSSADTQAIEVIVDGPPSGSIVDTHPIFNWHKEESCTPDKYRLLVTNDWVGATNSALEYPAGSAFSHTWTGIMQGGLHAYWRMAAITEDEVFQGPYSEEHDFYVGPLCSGETLVAPVLYRPIDAAWINHHHMETFEWHYKGGCLPLFYDYQFATDPGFTDIVDSGTTLDHKQLFNKSFPNCSTLFWRVRAKDGTNTGPWSDARQFHWVTDDTCWQNHYLSDNDARINVELYQDICDQTGSLNSSSTILNPGCALNMEENRIYGDGQQNSGDWNVWNYTVDLGAGPCPSTGLDQMNFDYLQAQEYFHVLAPGTYCVSINKNQTITQNGPPNSQDLNEGLWTDPFIHDPVASKTVTLGPGTQDVYLKFGWDKYEEPTLWMPMPEQTWCRVGPENICDPLGVITAGEMFPLLARDQNTEWKMASYQGETCFVYLPAVQVDEALSKVEGNKWLTADLPFYDPQPPCPTPTPEPQENQPTSPTGCAQYTTQRSCEAAKCNWFKVNDTTSLCIPY